MAESVIRVESLSRRKTLSVFGTRPEAIEMAPVVKALERQPERFISRVSVTASKRHRVTVQKGRFAGSSAGMIQRIVSRESLGLGSSQEISIAGDEYQGWVFLFHQVVIGRGAVALISQRGELSF